MERNSENLAMTSRGVIGIKKEFKETGVDFVVKKLCLKIRQNLSEDEWDTYQKQKTDRSRIELFLKTKEIIIQSHVQKKLHPAHKDKAKAMILKVAGNKAFGSGDNEKALYLYTQCLAWMPHDGTKDVGIVYANRAAALFGLEEYSLSKKDAELAFSLNYPIELHYKLFERLGRCCIELKCEAEARKNLKAAITALESSELDEQKVKKTKKVLEDLLKAPSHISHGFSNSKENGGCQTSPVIPDIAGGPSKYLRAASSRLTLQYQSGKGRFIIANPQGEGFRPGEVVLTEKALVSVLNPEQFHRQCFQCYSPLKAPIVCETCIFASYCSVDCQVKAKRHHHYECSILGLLKNSGVSVICFMAIRILTQEDPKNALNWYDNFLQEEEEMLPQPTDQASMKQSNNCRDKKRTLETLGFNEEYRTDHSSLFSLVTHSQHRQPESFLHQIVMALYLLEALKTTSYFDVFKTKLEGDATKENMTKDVKPSGSTSDKKEGLSTGDPLYHENFVKNGNPGSHETVVQTSISQNELGSRETLPLEVEIKFAVLLLRYLKCLQFNTHETAGWDRNKGNSEGVGGGLFPTLALFNHSCNPSIVRYFVNDTVVVRAIRTILPGEMVSENYGQNYSTVPRAERQAKLLDYYWFKCDCIACREDWPTFDLMTNDMLKFRCEHCRAFICKADENMGILFNCGKCKKSVNILKSLKSLQESDAKYKQAVERIESGQSETGLAMLLENVYLLETFLIPPFREYHMCQEHIRKCLLALGNLMSTLPLWDPETLKVEA